MMRPACVASVGPPNIMVPRQSCDTFMPLLPSTRYCILAIGPLPQNVLDHEAIDAGLLAVLDQDVAGRLAEGLEVGHRAGSVASTSSLAPFGSSDSAFLVFRIGSGQARPLVSSVLSGIACHLRGNRAVAAYINECERRGNDLAARAQPGLLARGGGQATMAAGRRNRVSEHAFGE